MTIDALLAKWLGREGGAERANYQMFLTELALALGLPTPDAKGQGIGDYEFEAPVRSEAVYGGRGTKRIDLYKRGCFILEAKQSRLEPGEADADEPEAPPPAETLFDLFGNPTGTAPAKTAGRPRRRYDRLMEDARLQAQRYALALPADHPTPPFIIVADIGRAFELYFDFAGNGRGYRPFPDERGYRVLLADLASPAPIAGVEADGRALSAAQTLRAIWDTPDSIDPRTRAAKVTRDIAERLSKVAEQLEKDQRALRPGDAEIALGIEATSLFLMRTLFCMFAEDVGLLPKDSFATFLSDAEGRSDQFWRRGLEDLWSRMNDPQEANRYWSQGDAIVRYFNGNLFAGARVYDLPPEFKRELRIAAGQDWRAVEPAIFGTLLEQVLTAADRAKLGAHYTPRPYVERLVQATIMDVLTPEWEAVREGARAKADAGDAAGAIADACAFHARLVATRILDPACGTGNFLYVAMEALLGLETDVRQFVVSLGGELAPGVHPNQFLGLELNPRAAVIAELVLWIGWLRYRLANSPEAIGDPVLPPLSNINGGTHGGFDAVLVRTATGEPDTANPRRPEWPEADFIVGNPPFIGGQDIRDRLGSDYALALWAANPRVPRSADFVMQWWDRAADLLTRPETRLRRFGFVTTNSITQVFSRRVIEGWLAKEAIDPVPPLQGEVAARRADGGVSPSEPEGAATTGDTPPSASPPPPLAGEAERKLHLVLAIADHPWIKPPKLEPGQRRSEKGTAAVRIAMTVAAAGSGLGRLVEIVREAKLDTDEPELEERDSTGRINANLSIGTDVTKTVPLLANEGISHDGVKLHGKGFSVCTAMLGDLGLGRRVGLEHYIKPYRSGNDLTKRTKAQVRDKFVIDLYGLDEGEVMAQFPEVYQYARRKVYEKTWNSKAKKGKGDWEGREVNNRKSYRELWWIFGEPRREMRPALSGLAQYIGTVDTAKHRTFQMIDPSIICDDGVVVVADEDYAILGVLSSRVHVEWALETGGWLGVGNDNRYFKSQVFDPYPFPTRSESVATAAKRLCAAREAAFADDVTLTMTNLYNYVSRIRDGSLPPEQEPAAAKARAFIVAKLHDDLDQAVADAYGWGEEWRRAPLPPAEIVRRLVALNAARAKEEKDGVVRWLRPDYQRPRFGRESDG